MPRATSAVALLVSLLVPLAGSFSLFGNFTNDDGCNFSWPALGCVPSKECRLQFKPRIGTFGPCVKKTVTVTKDETPAAEPVAAESAAAAAEEVPPSEETAEPAAAAEETPTSEDEPTIKDEP